MFNPNPNIQLVAIPGFKPCVVIENILQDPEALVATAIRERSNFVMASRNAFPGPELTMPEEFSARLNDFFILHIRKHLGIRRTLAMNSRLSIVTLQPHELSPGQRICHQDQITDIPHLCFAATVMYLFKNPALGGTSFYAPKVSPLELNQLFNSASASPDGSNQSYMTASSDHFELIRTIPGAWNRAIFYDSSIFHSGHMTNPALLNEDPSLGRLTLNGFFTCQRSAS